METKQRDTNPGFRPPSAGTAKIVTDRDVPALAEDLLSVLLHDLRSPLGAIGVLADLITAVSQDGTPPDQKQLQLLQEAVTKAQRVLDDAVEIQSVIRGSSTFSLCRVEIGTIVQASLEKAEHAPYLRNVQVDYNVNGAGHQLVTIDIEKAETAVLCALEHVVCRPERPSAINISTVIRPPYTTVQIENMPLSGETEMLAGSCRNQKTLRGRLGTRRLGESRFNLQVCKKVMRLMGGDLESGSSDSGSVVALHFPCVK